MPRLRLSAFAPILPLSHRPTIPSTTATTRTNSNSSSNPDPNPNTNPNPNPTPGLSPSPSPDPSASTSNATAFTRVRKQTCAATPPPPSSSPAPTPSLLADATHRPTPAPRDLDVVVTHSTADFDSLAAAVGLARLRGPNTLVVTPGGEGPALRRFLALHRQLFRITDPRAIDTTRLRWLGVVDTVRRHRLGIAADWPQQALHVVVFDHHIGRVCDIHNPHRLDLFVDNVGAVATLICERLHAAQHVLTPPEATLLALAIHSDTGSLTFEQTTPRDVAALSWLMQQGVIQRSIAEFTQNLLTDEQQAVLSQALSELRRVRVYGVEIASLTLVGRSFLKGLSAVANDLLDIANVDVLILGYVNCRGRKANKKNRASPADQHDQHTPSPPDQLKQVSIIGRARARVDGVDFRHLFAELGGGGHARAASASVKGTEADAERIIDALVRQVKAQIPQSRPVSEVMTTDVVTVSPNTPVGQALTLMEIHSHQILPVIDDALVLQGLITAQDIKLAERKRGEHAFELPVSAWIHQKVTTVPPDTLFHVAQKLVAEASLGMLPIVDADRKLLGVITRMDVLIARRLLPEDMIEQQQQRNWV